jgi:hypothetical protein
MENDMNSLWIPPSAENLPNTDATLEQIIRFAHSADPTMHFREQWGEEFTTNMQALWHRCIQSFKIGVKGSKKLRPLIKDAGHEVAKWVKLYCHICETLRAAWKKRRNA